MHSIQGLVRLSTGEDRWLCTLLLQQGYRVDYCAASDALTYAPENFNEFFNQRRRWTPSTIANIIDLLADSKNTVLVNSNISFFYILYQFILMVTMILGPSTIILAIATAFQSVLDTTLWQSYLLSLAPVCFYLVICFKCKTSTQLTVATFLSAIYACIMTVVLVGIIQTIVSQSILNPSLLFLGIISVSFVFSGLIHPYEFQCLLYGILYYLCIPAGYLVLIIYSISNLHVVSWGTREVKKRKSKAQREREKLIESQKPKQQEKKKEPFMSFLHLDSFLKDLRETLTQAFRNSKEMSAQKKQTKYMHRILKELRKQRKSDSYVSSDSDSDDEDGKKKNKKDGTPPLEQALPPPLADEEEEIEIPLDDPMDPNWIKDARLGRGGIENISKHEARFWVNMIEKYLKPIPKDVKKEKATRQELIELRTNSSFAFWFVNLLWVLFNYMITRDNQLNTISIAGYKTQPLGFIFIIFFVVVLILQIIGMIIHRWSTFLQLISITEITSPVRNQSFEDNLTPTEAIKVVKNLQRQSSDFFNDDDDAGPSDNAYEALPEDDKKKLIHNIHKFTRQISKKSQRRRADQTVVVSDDDERPHRPFDIVKNLERTDRERYRRRRSTVHYRDAIPRNITQSMAGRTVDARRGSRFVNDRRASHAPSNRFNYRDAHNPRRGYRRDDIEMRLRRRLRDLAHRNF